MGFLKFKGGIIRRERFKNWVEWMDVRFDSEEDCEVFVYKWIGKIIVLIEEFEVVVGKVYFLGYCDVKRIFFLVSLVIWILYKIKFLYVS